MRRRKYLAGVLAGVGFTMALAAPASAATIKSGWLQCNPQLMSSDIVANGSNHYHRYTLQGSSQTTAVRSNPGSSSVVFSSTRNSGYYGNTFYELDYDGYASSYSQTFAYCR